MSSSPASVVLFGSITHISLTYVICFILICVFFKLISGIAPFTVYIQSMTKLARTVAQVNAGQAPQKTGVALDQDQMKWVRSSVKDEVPNWLAANTNNPGGAKEKHTGPWHDACLLYVVGIGDRKQIHSPLHVRKLLSLSNKQVCWRGNNDLLALQTSAQCI